MRKSSAIAEARPMQVGGGPSLAGSWERKAKEKVLESNNAVFCHIGSENLHKFSPSMSGLIFDRQMVKHKRSEIGCLRRSLLITMRPRIPAYK